jgi:hypothetical protein
MAKYARVVGISRVKWRRQLPQVAGHRTGSQIGLLFRAQNAINSDEADQVMLDAQKP